MIVASVIHTDVWGIVSSCIYGASLIILYTMSTLYHSFTNKSQGFFRIMDHNTIFLLIAGTYTPITLYYLQGAVGWILFGIVWGAAIFGIVMNSINLEKARIPSIFCYVAMGWVIIFAIKPLIASMPSISLVFLIIGGAFYTLGIIFYAIKKVNIFTQYGISSPLQAVFFTTLQSYSDSGIYNKKRLSAGSRFSLKQRLQTDN